VESEIAVVGGHYVLEEGAEGGGASDAFAIEEGGVGGVELQDGLELFGAEILEPGLADFGEVYES